MRPSSLQVAKPGAVASHRVVGVPPLTGTFLSSKSEPDVSPGLLAKKASHSPSGEKKTEWAEKLSKKVYSSDIMLQANIGLERLKLDEISRLQVGDVLRFGEEGEPTVVLQANGRELYNCALGKSGNKYMVRVECPFGDEDWKDDI